MEIQKVFSNIEDPEETLYSVLMSEDEIALFSELQKEFNSKAQKALRMKTDLIAGVNAINKSKSATTKSVGQVINDIQSAGRKANRKINLSSKGVHASINDKIAGSASNGAQLLRNARGEGSGKFGHAEKIWENQGLKGKYRGTGAKRGLRSDRNPYVDYDHDFSSKNGWNINSQKYHNKSAMQEHRKN